MLGALEAANPCIVASQLHQRQQEGFPLLQKLRMLLLKQCLL